MNFRTELEPLDLAKTLGCGQTFRWRMLPDGSWRGPLDDQLVVLKKSPGSKLHISAEPGREDAARLVKEHLRAGDDIARIQRSLRSRDPVLRKGMGGLKGLRIVKMDEWECLVSFVLATYANIPRISLMIETLSKKYGEPIAGGVNRFPSRARLARAGESELRACGLGYRAPYVRAIAQDLTDDRLESMKDLDFEELRDALKELPGVGDKVADCVALFGFGRLEAFPIDVWMERALARLYHKRGSYTRLREFASERFSQYAGYAQEYLYYNERSHAAKGPCLFSEE